MQKKSVSSWEHYGCPLWGCVFNNTDFRVLPWQVMMVVHRKKAASSQQILTSRVCWCTVLLFVISVVVVLFPISEIQCTHFTDWEACIFLQVFFFLSCYKWSPLKYGGTILLFFSLKTEKQQWVVSFYISFRDFCILT